MISKVKLPFTQLTVKRERFFLLIIILDLISNASLLIGLIAPIIALILVFSEKSYNHSYFSFYKYYFLIISVIDIIIIILIMGYFFQQYLNSDLLDDSENGTKIFYYLFLILGFIFYSWKIFLANKFIEEMNVFVNTDEDSKNLQITISNENFDKTEEKKKDISKLSIIEEGNEAKKDEEVEKDKEGDVKNRMLEGDEEVIFEADEGEVQKEDPDKKMRVMMD